jgi:hypothetical protein
VGGVIVNVGLGGAGVCVADGDVPITVAPVGMTLSSARAAGVFVSAEPVSFSMSDWQATSKKITSGRIKT